MCGCRSRRSSRSTATTAIVMIVVQSGPPNTARNRATATAGAQRFAPTTSSQALSMPRGRPPAMPAIRRPPSRTAAMPAAPKAIRRPPPTTQPSGSSARPDVRGAASTRCRTDLTVAITRMTASKCMLVTVVPRSNPGGPPRHEGEQQRLSRLGDSVRVAAGPSRILRAIGGIAPGISVSMAAVPGRGDRGVADGCHRLGGPGRGHPACRDLGCRRR